MSGSAAVDVMHGANTAFSGACGGSAIAFERPKSWLGIGVGPCDIVIRFPFQLDVYRFLGCATRLGSRG